MRHIDEWDDRLWQQRRRLGFSFHFMSRWEDEANPVILVDDLAAPEVRDMLEEGRHQLLQDYLLGTGRGADTAWPIFAEAMRRAADEQRVRLWIARQYANHGYFAEAVDLLNELPAESPQAPAAQRLQVEVRWWRDHQDRIPWIPPASAQPDSRYRRMMARLDPDFAADPDAFTTPLPYMPPDDDKLPPDFHLPPQTPPDLIAAVDAATPNLTPPASTDSPVNWAYLDQLEADTIDTSQFPTWAQEMPAEVGDDPEHHRWLAQFLLERFSNPTNDENGEI